MHDHPILGKRCKAPDIVGPPISYMEECRIFKPVRVCKQSKRALSILPHKSREVQCIGGAEVSRVCSSASRLIQIAKGLGRQLTVVVFEGESVTPKCLLSELHSCMALSWYALHTSDEAKMGIRHRIFCCPICEYVANNPTTFLDHIVVGHYWGSFSCGVCLAFATLTTAGMKAHQIGCGQSEMERSKAVISAQESSSRFQVRPQVQRKEVQGRERYKRK